MAALVPEGTPVLANDEVELVPGPRFPQAASSATSAAERAGRGT